MARIKPEVIVDHLSSEFRKALAEAVSGTVPNAKFDEYELFRAFKRAVYRKCNVWEQVPDSAVESA